VRMWPPYLNTYSHPDSESGNHTHTHTHTPLHTPEGSSAFGPCG